MGRTGLPLLATGLCVVAVAAVATAVWWRSANVGPVQRGADLARAQGCLGCHGERRVSLLRPCQALEGESLWRPVETAAKKESFAASPIRSLEVVT